MSKGFKAGGGSANLLNCKVVGNLKPENPKENTIWVNTDVPITGWHFSATQPENMKPDEAWIITGISGQVEFNALKKNGIYLCPLRVKQYVDGALVYKEAQIYQNGWTTLWDGWLYNAGNQYEDITGGWQKTTSGSGSVTFGTSSISLSASSNGSANVQTKNLINLSGYDTLCVNVTARSGDTNRARIRVYDSNSEILAECNVTKTGQYNIDVSALDTGYIRLWVWDAGDGGTHKMTVDQIWLSGEISILLADLDAAYQEGVDSVYD